MRKITLIFILFMSCQNFTTSETQKGTTEINDILKKEEKLIDKKIITKKDIECIISDALYVFSSDLKNKNLNNIIGFENIPVYLVQFYTESDYYDSNEMTLEEFSKNYSNIFTKDFILNFSKIDFESFTKDNKSLSTSGISEIFEGKIKYEFICEFNKLDKKVTVTLNYIFPSDDPSLDGGTSIVYIFNIINCKVVIDNVIMVG